MPSLQTEDPDMTDAPDTKPRPSKSELMTRLLSRKAGADLATLRDATGWQPHSVRAALRVLSDECEPVSVTPAPRIV